MIDGANAWQSFKSITMPYILFITGPSLVNSLVANINNFNVIWLLSRDVYTTSDQLMANANANEVDLLVTWLYRLTQDQSYYKMASVIGILVFVVCAILTLVAFSRKFKGDKEESFQRVRRNMTICRSRRSTRHWRARKPPSKPRRSVITTNTA